MRFSLFILLVLHCTCSLAQGTDERSCHTNIELNIVIDTVYDKFDSIVHHACYCNPCYVLRPLNPKYKVVGFKIISETPEEIIERPFSGDTIGCNNGKVEISRARRGSRIYFVCIQAKHENGNVYILKDLFIVKR